MPNQDLTTATDNNDIQQVWDDISSLLTSTSTEVQASIDSMDSITSYMMSANYFAVHRDERSGQLLFDYVVEDHLSSKSVRNQVFSMYFDTMRLYGRLQDVKFQIDKLIERLRHKANVLLASNDLIDDREAIKRLNNMVQILVSEIETSEEHVNLTYSLEQAKNMMATLKPTVEFLLRLK
jgi:uncharacterized protein YaaN involved in tellurite resistance